MREEMELNRQHWDAATAIHTRENVYGIEDFKAGKCRLHRVEVEEIGDVRGKSLLHLQCHFGLDTLSWARRGARVTGIDFSSKAIALAKQLSAETNVAAQFTCTNLYELQSVLQAPGSFDIVYTSYGVICWLPDLVRWGQIIADYLRPAGFFYIVEAHPTARMFPIDADVKDQGPLRPYYSYFHDPAGTRWAGNFPDYADQDALNPVGEHEWLQEFPFCAWPVVAGCQVVEQSGTCQSYYGLRPDKPPLPLMFSIRARKR